MADLPLYACISQSQRELFDFEHLAKDVAHADLICCLNCSGYGYIDLGANRCPNCKCAGCLMDIQESDIKESDCE